MTFLSTLLPTQPLPLANWTKNSHSCQSYLLIFSRLHPLFSILTVPILALVFPVPFAIALASLLPALALLLKSVLYSGIQNGLLKLKSDHVPFLLKIFPKLLVAL